MSSVNVQETSTRREQDAEKRAAARQAVGLVRPGMVIGLGSGSTADFALHHLAERLAGGEPPRVAGIPTSEKVAAEAMRLGIPLTSLNDAPVIDMTIDGADEVDPDWNLIKGGGGALLQEKIVAQASRREVIVVDHTKRSPGLGTQHPVPVEVAAFGWRPEAFGPIEDLAILAAGLLSQAAVAEVGLFCGLATDLIVAGPDGAHHLEGHGHG